MGKYDNSKYEPKRSKTESKFGAGSNPTTVDPHPAANLLKRDGISDLLLRDGVHAVLLGH